MKKIKRFSEGDNVMDLFDFVDEIIYKGGHADTLSWQTEDEGKIVLSNKVKLTIEVYNNETEDN